MLLLNMFTAIYYNFTFQLQFFLYLFVQFLYFIRSCESRGEGDEEQKEGKKLFAIHHLQRIQKNA